MRQFFLIALIIRCLLLEGLTIYLCYRLHVTQLRIKNYETIISAIPLDRRNYDGIPK